MRSWLQKIAPNPNFPEGPGISWRVLFPTLFCWLLLSCTRVEKLDLSRLTLPPDFHIAIFAEAPHARQMAFSPGGVLLVSSVPDVDDLEVAPVPVTRFQVRTQGAQGGISVRLASGDVVQGASTLGEAYDRLIDSPIADMKNVGPREGGSITEGIGLGRITPIIQDVKVDKAYLFDGPNGKVTLVDFMPVTPGGRATDRRRRHRRRLGPPGAGSRRRSRVRPRSPDRH